MTKRTEGKIAGFAYLSYIVFALSSAVLSGRTTAGNDVSQKLMQIATTPTGGAGRALHDPALVSEILHRPDGFNEFCFVVGGFFFAYLFLRGRLIPRWLGWIDVITIGAQLIWVPLGSATMLPGSLVNWLWFPFCPMKSPSESCRR